MFQHPKECKLSKEDLTELMYICQKIAKRYICDDTDLIVFSRRGSIDTEKIFKNLSNLGK